MEDNTQCHVIKFNDASYCMSTFLPNGEMDVDVLTGSSGFSGHVDKNNMADIQAKMAGKVDNVWEMAKQALTTQSERFSLCVEGECLVVRKVGGKGARMRIADFKIRPLPSAEQAQAKIINFLLEASTAANQALAQTRQDLATKSEDLVAMRGMLQKATECQSEAKDLLLSECAVVLNEKKKMIRDLERNRGYVSPDLGEDETDSENGFKDDSTSNDSDSKADEAEESRGEKRKSDASFDTKGEKYAKSEANDSSEDGLFEDL